MNGLEVICGVDEAGRGPLAGPVYAAAVMLDPVMLIAGLADSKQLTAEERAALAAEIKARAVGWAVASASVEEIDALNILRASLLAMRRAVARLTPAPCEILVDGVHCPEVGVPVRAIVRGDSSVSAIAAASILAKVARDEEMVSLHRLHPGYGFDRHKGYSTPDHLEALRKLGACSVHRRSFAPVQAALNPGLWAER